jgi:hypothetical protein
MPTPIPHRARTGRFSTLTDANSDDNRNPYVLGSETHRCACNPADVAVFSVLGSSLSKADSPIFGKHSCASGSLRETLANL